MTTTEKEGWLIKNKQKRYFVLNNNGTLTWFDHPMGKAKRSIELKNYFIESNNKEIILSPKNKNSKEYKITILPNTMQNNNNNKGSTYPSYYSYKYVTRANIQAVTMKKKKAGAQLLI